MAIFLCHICKSAKCYAQKSNGVLTLPRRVTGSCYCRFFLMYVQCRQNSNLKLRNDKGKNVDRVHKNQI